MPVKTAFSTMSPLSLTAALKISLINFKRALAKF